MTTQNKMERAILGLKLKDNVKKNKVGMDRTFSKTNKQWVGLSEYILVPTQYKRKRGKQVIRWKTR